MGSVDTPLKNPRSGRLIVLAHSNVPSEGKDKTAELRKAGLSKPDHRGPR